MGLDLHSAGFVLEERKKDYRLTGLVKRAGDGKAANYSAGAITLKSDFAGFNIHDRASSPAGFLASYAKLCNIDRASSPLVITNLISSWSN